MNYYNKIKENLLKCEIYDREKDYSKERNRVITYFENGRLLTEAGKKYGENIIGEYANKLMLEVGRKYSTTLLKRMRQFYVVFSQQKGAPLAHFLSWSHYVELLPIKDSNKLMYYLDITIKQRLTKRALRERIKSKEYERLPIETKNKIITQKQLEVNDLIPNPIIIKSDGLKKELTEYDLKQRILNNIDAFLNQLGPNFSYIGNEYRIKMDNIYNYIDILLYNIEFNCYIVVELKVTELKKEHIGQIEVYMNYIDKSIKRISQNKTVGIIICRKNNRYVIEYSSDNRIIARTYELV